MPLPLGRTASTCSGASQFALNLAPLVIHTRMLSIAKPTTSACCHHAKRGEASMKSMNGVRVVDVVTVDMATVERDDALRFCG
jgi:hypothetical protein